MSLYDAFQAAIESEDPRRFAMGQDIPLDERKKLLDMVNAHLNDEEFLSLGPSGALSENQMHTFQELSKGTMLGDYRLVEPLGHGSFGVVYLAVDTDLGRQLAVKVSVDVGSEGKTLAKLTHPHIVGVYRQGVDRDIGCRYVAMQLIDGVDGSGDWLPTQRDRQPSRFFDLAIHLADALEYAHRQGILHLDIKPGNILFDCAGRPYLSDFNISSALDDAVIQGGTPGYMSPEQAQYLHRAETDSSLVNCEIDGRADVYSLARTLLTFLNQFFGNKVPHSLQPLLQYLEYASHLNPDERPQDAAAFKQGLENCRRIFQIRTAIKNDGYGERLFRSRPFLAFTLAVLLPQLLGSLVNITFNYTLIVSRLSASQGALFPQLVLGYNLIIYPICIAIIFALLHKSWGVFGMNEQVSSLQMAKVIDNTPKYFAMSISLGWLPGALMFPLLLDGLAGPIDRIIYQMFALSFVSGWLVSLTLSLAFAGMALTQVAVPEGLHGKMNLPDLYPPLVKLKRYMSPLKVMGGSIPLVGAVTLLVSPQMSLATDPHDVWKWVIVALILIGMVCYSVAYGVADRIRFAVDEIVDASK